MPSSTSPWFSSLRGVSGFKCKAEGVESLIAAVLTDDNFQPTLYRIRNTT
jgi:hypothetical protein